MSKQSAGYYLDSENKQWLEEKAKEIRRSASWYLNELLTQARQGKSDD